MKTEAWGGRQSNPREGCGVEERDVQNCEKAWTFTGCEKEESCRRHCRRGARTVESEERRRF